MRQEAFKQVFPESFFCSQAVGCSFNRNEAVRNKLKISKQMKSMI